MSNRSSQKWASLFLALVLALSLAACHSREPSASVSVSVGGSSSSYESSQPSETILPGNAARAREKVEINSDTVGWLQVPGTTVNDVVLWYPDDYNTYYQRRNIYGEYSHTGVYYADFRCEFGGGREGLAQNTVIYGHSMEDDPHAPLFSQLKKFLDEDFAREHPYISFSTVDDDMVFEVFAVFHCYTSNDRSNNFMIYNTPQFDTAQAYGDMIAEAVKRSVYTYDVPVSADDKLLTLSTCCYNLTSEYPNNYRYVVMAKLVDEQAELANTASFTVNPSPKQP